MSQEDSKEALYSGNTLPSLNSSLPTHLKSVSLPEVSISFCPVAVAKILSQSFPFPSLSLQAIPKSYNSTSQCLTAVSSSLSPLAIPLLLLSYLFLASLGPHCCKQASSSCRATWAALLVRVLCQSLSRVRLSAAPWTGAHQAPLSMGFSRAALLRCVGFSSWWLLLLQKTGSGHLGFRSCSTQFRAQAQPLQCTGSAAPRLAGSSFPD